MTIHEKDIIEADKSLQDFFNSLGPNDIYKLVFLEVLIEEIYGRNVDLSKIIPLEQDQPSSPSRSPLANSKDSPTLP